MESKNQSLKFLSPSLRKLIIIKALSFSIFVGGFSLDRLLAPYDPVLGHGNYNNTIANVLITKISVYLQNGLTDPQKGVIGFVAHRAQRLVQNPGLLFHYCIELYNDRFSKKIPKDIPYSELFSPTRNKIININGIEYGEYIDSINLHRIQTVTLFYTKGANPSLLLAPEITKTTASPNIYLAIPDPKKRNDRKNWFYIGNNPEASHTNAVAVKFTAPIQTGNIKITFGAGWLEPNPDNDMGIPLENLEKSTVFYGALYPNNQALPATGIMEIKKGRTGEFIFRTHNNYVGNIKDKNPPQFLYMTNDGEIKTLKGWELLDLQENPRHEGIIVQIANIWEFNKEQIDLINRCITEDNFRKKSDILDKIQSSIKYIEETKDVTWMIVAETDSGQTILSFALNMTNESEKTPGSYKITASIEEIIKLAISQNIKITNLKIINTGAEGSTSNLIFELEPETNDVNEIPESIQPTAFELTVARELYGVYWPTPEQIKKIRCNNYSSTTQKILGNRR